MNRNEEWLKEKIGKLGKREEKGKIWEIEKIGKEISHGSTRFFRSASLSTLPTSVLLLLR